MSGFNQTIVDTKDSERALGSRSKGTLQKMFPASPIHEGEINDKTVKTQAQELLLMGTVVESGGYYGFNPAFDRDYVDAPDILSVKTGPEGAPGTPYLPNPISPGPGSVSPTDQGKPPDTLSTMEPKAPFPGAGSSANPANTSAAIAAQNDGALTIGTYMQGESGA